MKKKIFALMMALVMALPLAACGDEPALSNIFFLGSSMVHSSLLSCRR